MFGCFTYSPKISAPYLIPFSHSDVKQSEKNMKHTVCLCDKMINQYDVCNNMIGSFYTAYKLTHTTDNSILHYFAVYELFYYVCC